jgi:uncharacterized protein YjdB
MRRKLLAISLGIAVAGVGCYQDELGPSRFGTATQVLLTDAPFPFELVDRVEVYVVEVAASTVADTVPGQQEWVTITTPRRRFDLLAVQQAQTVLVGEGVLPAGDYRAVRLTVDGDSSRLVMRDGRDATVHWPVAGEFSTFALVEAPLAVTDSGTQIVIDFDVGRSFAYPLFNPAFDFLFVPHIRAVNAAATGSLTGVVQGDIDGDGSPEPVENASVTVYRGDPAQPSFSWWVAATGHSDQRGAYTVGFLLGGSYIVQVDAPGSVHLGSVSSPDVAITPGMATTHSVTLPQFDASSIVIEGTLGVAVGASTALQAIVRDTQGVVVANPLVRWQSLNPAVATVNDLGEYGVVSGLTPGIAPIVATSLGLSDSVDVIVGTGADTTSVASVTVTPATLTLAVGDSAVVTAIVTDAAGNVLASRAITWTTSDSSVVQIMDTAGAQGYLRATGVGSASVSATSEATTGSAAVTVGT